MSGAVDAALSAALPGDTAPFALAFSGGGDSLALLRHLRSHPQLKAVLHVDHGLREESAQEAVRAEALAKELGHSATILTWSPGRIKRGLQEKARQARYGLMGQYCREHGLLNLVTAHHADDQAETVLMRLKRGSGWRGAAGMQTQTYAPIWPELADVSLVRPVLSVRQSDLREILGGLKPIEDRSNQDDAFIRIQIRKELQKSPALVEDMLRLSSDMKTGRNADLARLKTELKGFHLTHEGLFSVPRLLSSRALTLLAPIIGGQAGPANRSRLNEKRADIMTGRTVSLGDGCMAQWDGEILTLLRDPVAMTGRKDRRLAATAIPIVINETPQVWDGRFLVAGQGGQLHPERRGHHVGYRVFYGQNVRIKNLVQARLEAALTFL